MDEKMNRIVLDWYGVDDESDISPCDAGFKKGFEYCHDILMPLIIEAYPHVLGNQGAAHMLDGLRERQRKPIDDLVERIEAVLPE